MSQLGSPSKVRRGRAAARHSPLPPSMCSARVTQLQEARTPAWPRVHRERVASSASWTSTRSMWSDSKSFSGPRQRAFKALAGAAYALWHPPGESPENAIAFRRERWQLMAADSFAVPYFNGHIRRMPIIRLRDRVSGADVTFLNVHNPADTQQFRNQGRWRHAAVSREISAVRSLASGGSPVIMTGDLNDRSRRVLSAGQRWRARLLQWGERLAMPATAAGRYRLDPRLEQHSIQRPHHRPEQACAQNYGPPRCHRTCPSRTMSGVNPRKRPVHRRRCSRDG